MSEHDEKNNEIENNEIKKENQITIWSILNRKFQNFKMLLFSPFIFLFKIVEYLFKIVKLLCKTLFTDSFEGCFMHLIVFIVFFLFFYEYCKQINKDKSFTPLFKIMLKNLISHKEWLKNYKHLYFYLTKIAYRSRLMRILFFSLISHILITINTILIKKYIAETLHNITSYFDTSLEFLSESAMTSISYSYCLETINIIPFTFLYLLKSNSWVFKIQSDRFKSKFMIKYGFLILIINLLILMKIATKNNIINITFYGLLSFEYFLSFFFMFHTLFMLILDYFEFNSPFLTFISELIYYMSRIFVIGFYANNLSKHRLPLSYLKMLLFDINKLLKISKTYWTYVKIEKELNSLFSTDFEPGSSFCSICTDDIKSGIRLKCDHEFHMDCLKLWAARENKCPVCRKKITQN